MPPHNCETEPGAVCEVGKKKGLDLCAVLAKIMEQVLRGQNMGLYPETVEDVIQESYADVLQGIGRFNGLTKEQFAAWVRAIISNNRADTIKRIIRDRTGHCLLYTSPSPRD